MIKSITAAQKISISINIYANKYYPEAVQEDSTVELQNILASPFSFIVYPFLQVKWADRRPVSCAELINLAAGVVQGRVGWAEQEFEYSQKVKTTQNISFLFCFLPGWLLTPMVKL